ncbi:MAG TPA: cobalamin-independent methionine synthase II family protein [Trebonia sp.]|nr:cobalamin-independent methionine synthase II family protein [Trebonia sp.]
MLTSTDRIVTTHVGSLVKPQPIREALAAQQAGTRYDEESFHSQLADAVTEVVSEQVGAGIDVPSDGEFSKAHWVWYVTDRLNGVEPADLGEAQMSWWMLTNDRTQFADFYAAYEPVQRYDWSGDPAAPLTRLPAPIQFAKFTGPISYKGSASVQRDIGNFKAALAAAGAAEGFMPTAAPMAVELGQTNPAYKTDEEFVYALADALHEEYKAIVDAGLLLQVDDAVLPQWVGAATVKHIDRAEISRFADMRIEALNHALAGIPEDRVRFHICWGSWNGPHTSDAPLKDVIEYVLKVNAGAYLIESANPRHQHEWQIWEDLKLPDGKVLVPGVINHQTNVVEHPELVASRIQNLARLVGRENVIAGSDCGFCQGWHEVRVHPSIQWAKLRSLTEGARLASKQLWS